MTSSVVAHHTGLLSKVTTFLSFGIIKDFLLSKHQHTTLLLLLLLFVFKVYTNTGLQIIYHSKPDFRNDLSAEQRSLSHPIQYIWITLAAASTSASTNTELLHAFPLLCCTQRELI
ncbi:hypothetical protein GOODEAATRI_021444 [Goodea atripinnis]|uniref:NADH dehydrogenase subunit 4 n=1 Tax=Goodea atripinnis TaxID=208336 RepID=A0ABV0MJR5_9TELE